MTKSRCRTLPPSFSKPKASTEKVDDLTVKKGEDYRRYVEDLVAFRKMIRQPVSIKPTIDRYEKCVPAQNNRIIKKKCNVFVENEIAIVSVRKVKKIKLS